jgi:hypothetical protein
LLTLGVSEGGGGVDAKTLRKLVDHLVIEGRTTGVRHSSAGVVETLFGFLPLQEKASLLSNLRNKVSFAITRGSRSSQFLRLFQRCIQLELATVDKELETLLGASFFDDISSFISHHVVKQVQSITNNHDLFSDVSDLGDVIAGSLKVLQWRKWHWSELSKLSNTSSSTSRSFNAAASAAPSASVPGVRSGSPTTAPSLAKGLSSGGSFSSLYCVDVGSCVHCSGRILSDVNNVAAESASSPPSSSTLSLLAPQKKSSGTSTGGLWWWSSSNSSDYADCPKEA